MGATPAESAASALNELKRKVCCRLSSNISISLTEMAASNAQTARKSLPLAQNRKRLAPFWFAIYGGRFSP